jgi:UDP-N-acetylmuramate--alanine ligase
VDIAATIQMAREVMDLKKLTEKKLVVVYQPHQNIRQHEIQSGYANCFKKADKVYWLPTFLTREKQGLSILSPEDLVKNVSPEDRQKIMISELDSNLAKDLKQEIESGNLVLVMGAGTIDKWAREGLV